MKENDSRTESWRLSNREAARDLWSHFHGYVTLLKSNLDSDREQVAEEEDQTLQGAIVRQFGLAVTSVVYAGIYT
jgi:hypothetical protein